MNKWLADQGLGSRRLMDQWILDKRVTIGGVLVESPGISVEPYQNDVYVDGRHIRPSIEKKIYLAFYKPRNVITSMKDPRGRPCISDYLSSFKVRLFPVGRLDFDAEGLLILTNDGDWAQKLLHPKYEHDRIYEVTVEGHPTQAEARSILEGVELDDGFAHFSKIEFMSYPDKYTSAYRVSIGIGRYHIVKRLWQHIGRPVLTLKRTQIAGIKLGDLHPSEHRNLTAQEINSCLSS